MFKPANAIAVALAAIANLLAALPAAAADGEILINQAKVLAGGITPGDTAGFPAVIDRSGRYKLSGNLRVPDDTDGIEIHANDVTIDLNGFTISSQTLGGARGGVFGRSDRIRIINGTLSGFGGFGVYLAEGDGHVVENMRFIAAGGPSWGAIYMNGRQARIRNNTIANASSGIVACGACLIEGNVVTGMTYSGISVMGGTVIGNVIVGNTSWGLTSSGNNFPDAGYGENILVGNNIPGYNGGTQVFGNNVFQLHPNVCDPACP